MCVSKAKEDFMLLKTKYNNNKKKKKIFYRIRCCVYIGIPGRIQKK